MGILGWIILGLVAGTIARVLHRGEEPSGVLATMFVGGSPPDADRWQPPRTRSIAPFERHRANILEKLGMRDRVELTRYAIRRGLIEP